MSGPMPRYAPARKSAILAKLLPPLNRPVAEVAKTEGISAATLYSWLTAVKAKGQAVPGSRNATTEAWSGEAKLAVVLETAGLNAHEVSEYCRRKGLYPEQVAAWRQACLTGVNGPSADDNAALQRAQQRVRTLEKEVRRKDKALAESAALLVLQKKFQALWADEES